MIVCVPKEIAPNERRVALVPDLVAKLTRAGLQVVVQTGAGDAAGYPDSAYSAQGARLEPEVLGSADVVLKVQPPSIEEIGRFKEGATLIGMLQPYSNFAGVQALAARRVTAFSLEL